MAKEYPILECVNCGHEHLFEDRIKTKFDEFETRYYCPKCKTEESYMNADEKD